MMMTRPELIFQIGLSARLERMTATLLGRMDRGASFLTLFLSASIFANVASWLQYAIAVMLCAITFFTLVYQPAAQAVQANFQRAAYDDLYARADVLTDRQLHDELNKLQQQDSAVPGALSHPAHFGEAVRLNLEPNVRMMRYEKIVAWLAGDLPRQSLSINHKHTGASIKKPAGFNTRRASQILWAHLSHPNISTLAITFRNLIYHFCQLDLSLFRSASDIKHIHRVSMQRDDEKYTPLSQAHASHELIAF